MAFDLFSLLTSIPSLMSDFSGSTSAPYLPQQEQIANRMNQLSQAQTDTNNPLYKQLYGQYQQQNRNNLAQVIAEAQAQNRMNTRMGRTPLFDPSRGGETLFRSLMQNYQNQGVQADTQAREALKGAMGGSTTSLAGYNAISPYAQRANAQQLSGYQGIYDLLRGGNSVGSMGGGNYSSYNPGPIMWNTG